MLETDTLDFLAKERQKSLSKREWHFRMKGYGFGIRDHGDRQVVTKLPQGITLGILPANFA
ncbi:MAG: hypothetical protein HEP69_17400 [Aestuariivita sp.]|nr:hypothetical protein [Aestuariivita sp.]